MVFVVVVDLPLLNTINKLSIMVKIHMKAMSNEK